MTWPRFDELRSGQTTWVSAIGPTTIGPDGLRTGPAGYDPERATFVMVSLPNEGMATWEYALGTGSWTDRSTATAPSDVWETSLWWNSATARIDMLVLAGPVLSPEVSVWEWNHVQGTWAAVLPSQGSSRPTGITRIEAISADTERGQLVAWFVTSALTVELWAWDAAARTWSRLSPDRWPTLWPPRIESIAPVYDSVRQRMVFVGSGFQQEVVLLDWDGTAPVFTDRHGASPAAWPRNLEKVTAAYDRHRRRIVICGPPNPGQYAELWEWSGDSGTWTNLTPATLPATWPSCRSGHMAYDAGRRRIVVWSDGILTSALWELDPQTGIWQRPPLPTEVDRLLSGLTTAIAYDEKRARIVITSTGLAIGEWDGSVWTLPAVGGAGQPTDFNGVTSTYDARHGRVVVMTTGFEGRRRLWSWDGARLVDETSAGFTNLGASGSGLLYDLARGNLVWVGGLINAPNPNIDNFLHVFEGNLP